MNNRIPTLPATRERLGFASTIRFAPGVIPATGSDDNDDATGEQLRLQNLRLEERIRALEKQFLGTPRIR